MDVQKKFDKPTLSRKEKVYTTVAVTCFANTIFTSFAHYQVCLRYISMSKKYAIDTLLIP